MRRLAVCALVAVLTAMAIGPPGCRALDLPPTEGDLTIAGYEGDGMRSDDHRSLSVSETLFLNNSGTERFSGNITLWVQPGAHIASRLCGSAANRVVRVEAGQTYRCFDLAPEGDGFHRLRPFDEGQFLSYYGETHDLSVDVTTRNTTGNERMAFSATVGPSATTPGELTVGNVTVRASDTTLGAPGFLAWGPPRNLTFVQPVTIENDGGQGEDVDLAVLGAPSGWTARLEEQGRAVTRVSLSAGQNLTLALNVSAPSHLVHIYLEYTIQGGGQASGSYAVTLEKVFAYNTTYARLYIYALADDVLAATGYLETHSGSSWNATYERRWYMVLGFDVPAGSVSTVTVTWNPPPFVFPAWAIAAIAALGSAMIAYPLWLRRRRRGERAEGVEREHPEPVVKPMSPQELRARRQVLRGTLDRLATDGDEGGLPPDLHEDLRQEAQAELLEVERRLVVLTTAQDRKRKIVQALRRLERDFKEGTVDRAVYASLKAKYEQEAMKAMKRIDEARGVASEAGEDRGT